MKRELVKHKRRRRRKKKGKRKKELPANVSSNENEGRQQNSHKNKSLNCEEVKERTDQNTPNKNQHRFETEQDNKTPLAIEDNQANIAR